jgi:hypothetical protein
VKNTFFALAAATASVALVQPAFAATWSQQDILDGECIAFYAATVGELPEGEEPDPGLMAITGYFVGKVEGRNPSFDLTELLTVDLIMRVETNKDRVAVRCAEEALVMAESMMKAGTALQATAGN